MKASRAATLLLAVSAFALVPLTKVALLFSEYRLHLAVAEWVQVSLLALALGVAVSWAVVTSQSWQGTVVRAVSLLVFAGLAYFVVLFVPGCLWAPACL
jgi:hypothetical protein